MSNPSILANLFIVFLFSLLFAACSDDDMEKPDPKIMDTTPPDVVCIEQLVKDTLDVYGTLTIYAENLDNGSTDDITSLDDLHFSFRQDTVIREHVITCADIIEDVEYFDLTLWVTDDSGNQSSCSVTLEVADIDKACVQNIDTTPPAPICTDQRWVGVFNDYTIDIWASDFNSGSTDDVTSKENLRYSFSGDSIQNPLTINCDDIPNGNYESFEVEMWVWDESDNRDFCSVTFHVEDNLDFCEVDNCTNRIVPVCVEILTAVLDSTGSAVVSIDEFDNGSYSLGGPEDLENYERYLERQDNASCVNMSDNLSKEIIFCTEDIGNDSLYVSLYFSSGFCIASCQTKVNVTQ